MSTAKTQTSMSARFARLFGERFRAFLIAIGWSVLNAGATLVGIFSGALIPPRTYAGGGLLPLRGPNTNVPLDMQFAGVGGSLDLPPVLGLPFGKFLFFLEILAIAVFASLLIGEFQKALVSAIVSYGLGAILVGFVLILPGMVGASQFPDVLDQAAVFLTFSAFFPIPLFLVFVGTILGVILSEKFYDTS